MTTTAQQPEPQTPDAGVIEEARARQRRHRGVAGATTVIALAVAGLLFAFAGGGGGSHPAGAPTPAPTPAAKAASSSTSAACLSGRGRTLKGAPAKSLLSILGVLRHPATAADAIGKEMAGRGLIRDVFVNYIRRTQVVSGGSYFIYPAIIGGCGVESRREGMMELATNIDLGSGITGGTGGGGDSASSIEQGRAVGTGPPGSPTSATVTMIVPDGVSRVTLRYPAGRASGYSPKISPPVTITGVPINNELVVSVPRSGGGGPIWKPRMLWRSADGRVIRTFDRL